MLCRGEKVHVTVFEWHVRVFKWHVRVFKCHVRAYQSIVFLIAALFSSVYRENRRFLAFAERGFSGAERGWLRAEKVG
jgi:hypothetical protein